MNKSKTHKETVYFLINYFQKITRAKIIVIIFIFSLLLISCNDDNKRLLVLGKISKVSKFSTTKIVVNKLVIGEKNLSVFKIKNFSTANFVADSEATIKLGIDFEKLEEKDISINDNIVSLTLPPIEVISFSYPAEKFEYKEDWSSNSPLVKIRPRDQDEIFGLAEMEIRESLLSMGVIETCKKNTSLFLKKLLSEEFDEVYLKYKRTESLFPQFDLDE